MCFFKAPKLNMATPNVTAAMPEDATAPEPNAPVFGGTEKALMDSAATGETKGKTGISSVKIKSEVKMPSTGVNRYGFNGDR